MLAEKHKTPGSKSKDFIIHSTIGSMNFIFVSVLLSPETHRGNTELHRGYFISELRKTELRIA